MIETIIEYIFWLALGVTAGVVIVKGGKWALYGFLAILGYRFLKKNK